MPSPTRSNNPGPRAKTLRLAALLGCVLAPWVFLSCITDKPKEETKLVFSLDTARFAGVDSILFEIFASADSTTPVQSQVIKLPPGTTKVEVKLSEGVGADFFIVVTAFDDDAVTYRKQHSYAEGQPDPDHPPAVMVTAIKGPALALGIGEARKPELTFEPADAPDKRVILESEDTTVARVKGDSLVGVKAGTTHATVTTLVGVVQLRFAVTVTAIRVAKLSVADTVAAVGDTLRPVVGILPANATNKDYSFTSQDTSVVAVAGKSLRALKPGTAEVIAASVDFGARDTFTVTVRLPVEGLTAADLSMTAGDVRRPDLDFTPADATDLGYSLSSGDSAVVRIRGDSLEALAQGFADVTATSDDGGFSDVFRVTVSARIFHPDSVRATDKRLLVGDTVPATLRWVPDNTTDKGFALKSLDTAVAGVAGTRVFGKALGTAEVEVTAADGGVKDTFDVKVEAPNFTTDILPITSTKCAPCHIAGTTFDWQDSAALVRKGVSAIDRLNRPEGAVGKMPLAGASGGPITARELNVLLGWLGRVVVPLQSYSVRDTSVQLGDTLRPVVVFTPPNASNRVVSLTTVDSNFVSVLGGTVLVPQAIGQTTIIAESDETKSKINFKVTVKAPDFLRNVKPITGLKCAPCHIPGTTFNWQDSTALLEDGAQAIDRLTRPDTAVGRMPLKVGSPNGDLAKHELAVLLGWLRSKVVPLVGITVPDDSVRMTEKKAPAIVWNPANATGRLYDLTSRDTGVVVIRGAEFQGKALGTAQVEIRTREGNHTKVFNVKVIPIRVDSITVRDTGAFIGDTITPVVTFHPANATNKEYTLTEGTASGFVTIIGKRVASVALGTANIAAIPQDGGVIKGKVFKHIVAPIMPASLSVRDTNGVIDQLVTPTVAFTPANTTNKAYKLVIAAADTNTAVVAGTQVKGKAVGAVNVTMKALADTTKIDVFRYTVGPVPVTGISVAATTIGVGSNAVTRNFITWSPTNATNKNFTMASSNEAQVRVNADSSVTGLLRPGTTVTVTAADNSGGTKQAVWTVNVVRSPHQGTIANIIAAKCSGCHFPGNPVAAPHVWDSTTMVNPTPVPDHPTRLKNRLTGVGGFMPPSGSLHPDTVAILVNWLNQ